MNYMQWLYFDLVAHHSEHTTPQYLHNYYDDYIPNVVMTNTSFKKSIYIMLCVFSTLHVWSPSIWYDHVACASVAAAHIDKVTYYILRFSEILPHRKLAVT